MAKKEKKLPELLPCKCGGIAVTLRLRGGAWTVYCLCQTCDRLIRGFATEEEAILAWNKEVQKRGTTGERH